MSATQEVQTLSIQDLILQEAERLSMEHFKKPYAELDNQHKGWAIEGAKGFLRTRMTIPGECCDCGARIAEDKYQCRPCHEGFAPGEWNAYDRKLAQMGLL
jgi:hypothetical protein